MENLRSKIVLGAASQKRTLDPSTVESLVAKIVAKAPENPEAYAWCSGRNKAVSLNRHEAYAAKLEVERLREAEIAEKRAQQEALEGQRREAALAELMEKVGSMFAASGPTAFKGIWFYRYLLEGNVDAAKRVYDSFSCGNQTKQRNNFYQAKHRGLDVMKRFLSAESYSTIEGMKQTPVSKDG